MAPTPTAPLGADPNQTPPPSARKDGGGVPGPDQPQSRPLALPQATAEPAPLTATTPAPALTAPALTAPALTTPTLTAPAQTAPKLTAPILTAPATSGQAAPSNIPAPNHHAQAMDAVLDLFHPAAPARSPMTDPRPPLAQPQPTPSPSDLDRARSLPSKLTVRAEIRSPASLTVPITGDLTPKPDEPDEPIAIRVPSTRQAPGPNAADVPRAIPFPPAGPVNTLGPKSNTPPIARPEPPLVTILAGSKSDHIPPGRPAAPDPYPPQPISNVLHPVQPALLTAPPPQGSGGSHPVALSPLTPAPAGRPSATNDPHALGWQTVQPDPVTSKRAGAGPIETLPASPSPQASADIAPKPAHHPSAPDAMPRRFPQPERIGIEAASPGKPVPIPSFGPAWQTLSALPDRQQPPADRARHGVATPALLWPAEPDQEPQRRPAPRSGRKGCPNCAASDAGTQPDAEPDRSPAQPGPRAATRSRSAGIVTNPARTATKPGPAPQIGDKDAHSVRPAAAPGPAGSRQG